MTQRSPEGISIPDAGDGSLKHQFLLAMPQLDHGIFAGSIVYLCEHDARGAMGLIVNRPLELTLGELCDHLELPVSAQQRALPVLAGGPVHTDHGFVLHPSDSEQTWDATLVINGELSLSSSRDVLAAIAEEQGPSSHIIALGYAGWGAGQLEAELAENAWLTLPADLKILFDTPLAKRAVAAAERYGIDLHLLTSQAGHA
jgi:putative transcriptional regulator